MKWKNLVNNKCPRCEQVLENRVCPSRTTCKFRINEAKFNEIVSSYYKPKKQYVSFESNMSALNNLGRQEVTEDFSDSRFLDY